MSNLDEPSVPTEAAVRARARHRVQHDVRAVGPRRAPHHTPVIAVPMFDESSLDAADQRTDDARSNREATRRARTRHAEQHLVLRDLGMRRDRPDPARARRGIGERHEGAGDYRRGRRRRCGYGGEVQTDGFVRIDPDPLRVESLGHDPDLDGTVAVDAARRGRWAAPADPLEHAADCHRGREAPVGPARSLENGAHRFAREHALVDPHRSFADVDAVDHYRLPICQRVGGCHGDRRSTSGIERDGEARNRDRGAHVHRTDHAHAGRAFRSRSVPPSTTRTRARCWSTCRRSR